MIFREQNRGGKGYQVDIRRQRDRGRELQEKVRKKRVGRSDKRNGLDSTLSQKEMKEIYS